MQSCIRLGGSYFQLSKTGICNNFEKSIFTKIVSSKDPQWRIESCIAPGLPTNGRWTWGKAVRLFRTTRLGGLTYRNQFDLPKADQFIPIIIIRKMAAYHRLPFSLKYLNKLFRGTESPRLPVDNSQGWWMSKPRMVRSSGIQRRTKSPFRS